MRTRKTPWLLALTVTLAWAAGGCGDDDGQPDGSLTDGASQLDGAPQLDGTLPPDAALPTDGGADTDTDAASTTPILDALLTALRSDAPATAQAQSEEAGWPAPVEGGWLFVSLDPALTWLGGDHDTWQGQAMTADQGFSWIVLAVGAGTRYKLTEPTLTAWESDPWSRAYEWDAFGLMSMTPPPEAHLERFFNVSDANIEARTVRVWVPGSTATHVLYVADGQNLFDPNAPWGGWQLQATAPAGMMLVGIDNSLARTSEYTHVPDVINGSSMGGAGDDYADFVHVTVRALVTAAYGEPPTVGLMGSSLGGLISFHIAHRYPGAYDYAASLSGTMGWGSITAQNETMIERYAAAGHGATALYLDSGGNGTCYDSDGDGIEDDDPTATDNYCENKQLESLLYGLGYVAGVDVWHWWEPDALHNEAAWAARVWRPLDHFAAL